MPFTADQLLLTDDRKAQLVAALENIGISDPLEYIIEEAVKVVELHIAGYTVAEETRRPWIRAIALYTGFTPAEAGVPADIKAAYDAAMKTLEAIRDGKFPGLAADPDAATPSQAGAWGSSTKITMRTSSSS